MGLRHNCTGHAALPGRCFQGPVTSSVKFELFNGVRVGAVVAVAQPVRPHPHVFDVRVGSSLAPVWELFEVGGRAADQILAQWQGCPTLTLKRDLVVPADHERDPWVRADVATLARGGQRVEYDLAFSGRSDAD